MQDPNADTQWNDVLRSKGIIPQKEQAELTEEDVVSMVENSVQKQSQGKGFDEMNGDELDELEDDIDEEEERIFEMYRRQRIEEMKAQQAKSCYGDVREISKADYVREVNEAGDGVWVVLHVYRQGIPLCSLIDNHLNLLARKFPATKFLRSAVSVCIPNYPERNLPTLFVYTAGEMRKQMIGPHEFGGTRLTCDELEWILSQVGAVTTTLECCPRPAVRDVLASSVRGGALNRDSDSDDD